MHSASSGNMPEFAQADPHAFWVAADAHERANGRTPIQSCRSRASLPGQRHELAREARELLDDRFAYTLAVHVPPREAFRHSLRGAAAYAWCSHSSGTASVQ